MVRPGEMASTLATEEGWDACMAAILAVFPDICPDYLRSVAQEKGRNSEVVTAHILDQLEDGNSYPKRPKAGIKRKRETEDDQIDEETRMAKRFAGEDHRRQCESIAARYNAISKAALSEFFPRVPCKQLYGLFELQGKNLFATVLAMQEVMDNWDDGRRPFELNKRARELDSFGDDKVDADILNAGPGERQALEEVRAARVFVRARAAQNDAEQQRLMEEQANLDSARAEGTAADCECCYSECARNRMVFCNAETPHYFCKGCARRMAETQIGLSKHSLACMSTDGCAAGFSEDQKQLFLDSKLRIALERIEQEEALRLAGIENLETCPFCPFAAEYPEVGINKEFRCQNPDCEVVSCRLCRKETHIPQTCQEAARENGCSARRAIEEAMSAALIRKCNKCGTPFIKENGCNKMTCTRGGCYNVQCYVCHQSCDYRHFDDPTRGGKTGNCPLFESVEQRHDNEVRAAEEKARQEVAQADPELDAEILKIKVSDKVKEDEKKRRDASDAMHQPYRARHNAQHHRGIFHQIAALHGLVDAGILGHPPPPPPPSPPPHPPPPPLAYPNPPQAVERVAVGQGNVNWPALPHRALQLMPGIVAQPPMMPHFPAGFPPIQYPNQPGNAEQLGQDAQWLHGDALRAAVDIFHGRLANARAHALPAEPAPRQRALGVSALPNRAFPVQNPVPPADAFGQIARPLRGSRERPIQLDPSPPRHVARVPLPPAILAAPHVAQPNALVNGHGGNQQPIVAAPVPKELPRTQPRRASRQLYHHIHQHQVHHQHNHNHRNGEWPPAGNQIRPRNRH